MKHLMFSLVLLLGVMAANAQQYVVDRINTDTVCLVTTDTIWATLTPAIPTDCCKKIELTTDPIVDEQGKEPAIMYRLQLCATVNPYERVPDGAFFRKEGCLFIMYSKSLHPTRADAEAEKKTWPGKWDNTKPFITLEYH